MGGINGFHLIIYTISHFLIMLTSALRVLVKDSKKETIVKFYVKKVTSWYFNKSNTQFST